MAVAAAGQAVIEGTVRDNAGQPVSGASLAVQRAEGSIAQQGVSDASGKFRFAGLGAGSYKLKTESSAFYPSIYDFVLRGREQLSLNVELRKKEAVKKAWKSKANM